MAEGSLSEWFGNPPIPLCNPRAPTVLASPEVNEGTCYKTKQDGCFQLTSSENTQKNNSNIITQA